MKESVTQSVFWSDRFGNKHDLKTLECCPLAKRPLAKRPLAKDILPLIYIMLITMVMYNISLSLMSVRSCQKYSTYPQLPLHTNTYLTTAFDHGMMGICIEIIWAYAC